MRLGLGTVQFGMPYGILDSGEQVRESDVGRILDAAHRLGVDLLDTAAAYGSSEVVLGKSLRAVHDFKIVTKALPGATGAGRVRADFLGSLARLRRNRIYGLLVHRCEDLMGPEGGRLFDELLALKGEGLVERVGVSVYTASHIDAVTARFPIDLVQLPVNVLDQRLLRSGHLSRLHEAGIEIHARSAFLQGLLLANPRQLQPRFASVSDHLLRYHSFIRGLGVEPVTAALGFLAGLPQVDYAVVGVASTVHLEQAVAALARRAPNPAQLAGFAWHDDAVLDPSRWS